MSILASDGDVADLPMETQHDAELLQNELRPKSRYLWLKSFCDILIVVLVTLPVSLVILPGCFGDPFDNGTAGLFRPGAHRLGRQNFQDDQATDNDAKSGRSYRCYFTR